MSAGWARLSAVARAGRPLLLGIGGPFFLHLAKRIIILLLCCLRVIFVDVGGRGRTVSTVSAQGDTPLARIHASCRCATCTYACGRTIRVLMDGFMLNFLNSHEDSICRDVGHRRMYSSMRACWGPCCICTGHLELSALDNHGLRPSKFGICHCALFFLTCVSLFVGVGAGMFPFADSQQLHSTCITTP